MSASAIYARTIGAQRFTILGLQLQTLTIGHVRLLHAMECMDANDPGELALACVVCSLPWRQVLPSLESPDFNAWAEQWGKDLGEWDFAEKRQDWDDYLRVNMELPKVIVRGASESSGTPTIPPHQTLRTLLLSRLGYSADTVDDTPYLQGMWDAITLRQMDGAVQVLSKTEEQIEAEAKAVDVDAILARLQPKEAACSV